MRTLIRDLDALTFETQAARLTLDNTFNSFLMLSNTQFIENRVYDEPGETVTEKPKAAETKESVLEENRVEKFSLALKAGNCALLSCLASVPLSLSLTLILPSGMSALELFAAAPDAEAKAEEKAKADKENSDSEDEKDGKKEEPKAPADTKPKDPYNSVPLPFVIGTRAFLDDDNIGETVTLVHFLLAPLNCLLDDCNHHRFDIAGLPAPPELPDSDVETENKHEESDSESDKESKNGEKSDSDSGSDSEGEGKKAKAKKGSDESGSESGSESDKSDAGL